MSFKGAQVSMSVVLCFGLFGCSKKVPLHVTSDTTTALFDVQTLGEYPTTVRRIKIEDSGQTILDVQAVDTQTQLRTFAVHKGTNVASAIKAEHGSFRTLIPVASAYVLNPGVTYTVSVWGNGKPTKMAISFK